MRKVYMGDDVHIRGIIELFHHRRKDCLYCGLRKNNDRMVRYRMGLEEIFQAAQEAQRLDSKIKGHE